MTHNFRIHTAHNLTVIVDENLYYLCNDNIVRGSKASTKKTFHLFYFETPEHAETVLNNYLKQQEPTMNTLNTDADILNALLSGKKLRDEKWDKESYIHMVDNKIVCNKGNNYSLYMSGAMVWEEWKAPLTLADLKPGQFARITGYKTDNKFIHIGKTAFCFGHAHHGNALQVVLVEYPSWVSPIVEGNEMLTKIECQLIDNPFAS